MSRRGEDRPRLLPRPGRDVRLPGRQLHPDQIQDLFRAWAATPPYCSTAAAPRRSCCAVTPAACGRAQAYPRGRVTPMRCCATPASGRFRVGWRSADVRRRPTRRRRTWRRRRPRSRRGPRWHPAVTALGIGHGARLVLGREGIRGVAYDAQRRLLLLRRLGPGSTSSSAFACFGVFDVLTGDCSGSSSPSGLACLGAVVGSSAGFSAAGASAQAPPRRASPRRASPRQAPR